MRRFLQLMLFYICCAAGLLWDIPSAFAAPTTWITLNGTSQYYDAGTGSISTFNAITNKITVEAWVRTKAPSQLSQIIASRANNGSFSLEYNSGSDANIFRLALYINGGYRRVTGKTNPVANTWYHVCGTYDGANMRIYVNGTLENTLPITGNVATSTMPLQIGENPPAEGQLWNGDIAELRIWNVARTEAQIDAAINSTLTGTETGLIGYWNFNAAGTGITYDKTASGNDATGINFTAFAGTATPNQTSVDFTLTNVANVNETNEITRGGTVEYSAANGTAYTDYYLAPGTAYSYMYKAKTTYGESVPRTFNVTTLSMPPPTYSLTFPTRSPHAIAENVSVNTAAGTSNTIEFWYKWDGTPTQMPFSWGISPGYTLYNTNYQAGGYFGINTGAGDVLGFPFPEYVNKWVHVAAVMPNGVAPDATNSKIYLNGELQPIKLLSTTKPTQVRSATSRASFGAIGEPNNPAGYGVAGQLAEWKIWRGERTAAQVAADATAIPTGTETGLAGYWRPDPLTTGKVYDKTAGNHDAICYLFPDNLTLKTTSVTKSQVALDWNAVTGALTPITYALTQSGTQIFSSTSATAYTHTGLLANEPYSYAVQGSNANGESVVSTLDITTPRGIADLTVPATIAFPATTLTGNRQTVSVSFPSAVTVVEENGDGFVLQVNASQFRAASNAALTLPVGSLRLLKASAATLQSGRVTTTPLLYGPAAIDTGTTVNVAEASAGTAKGTVSITFPSNALQLTLNPETTRTDKTLGASGTQYQSVLNWTLAVGNP